ncbi:MAG: hypothetical protein A4E24_01034 [Methanomethylovorans sp. PtaU1.Bin093]|uniref:hypothetical protein n=1 Tax=Methanomethylovorans sp. PtaU1.Bin093 TaxID=1811679 RepID=UPI0009CE68EC|nr:hypothetical protein [Methanomethylovorans sp. PtaU1.Bin093]OPY20700.1 MAG: hypothetical protein A4E24_01034 [Methanomethylovorans sp. PtaU1.Bin093]
MSQNLSEKINDVLADRQLSISAITRELKDKGFVEHRLVLTGYLRALRDLKKLQEIEVPPSKVYRRLEHHEKCTDIYSMVGDQIKNLDMEVRLPLAIYIISRLFKRPVFREELLHLGINNKSVANCLESSACMITLSRDENLKLYRSEITRISIPVNDPAYEIKAEDGQMVSMANIILMETIKDLVDLSGLTPKTKQTKLVEM